MSMAQLMPGLRALLISGVLIGAALILPPGGLASELEIDVAKPEAIRITLEQQVGKRVALKLVGGGEVEGMAKKVGPDAVHLAELSGKEFFDAVVRIDQISAVIVRVKTK